MQLVGMQALDIGVGTVEVAVGGTLHGATVMLVQANIVFDRHTLLSALVSGVATYTGYADAAITWDTPSLAPDGAIQVLGSVGEFRPTDSATPNVIYGIAVIKADRSQVYFVAPFDNPPIPMESSLNVINLTLQWRPDSGGFVAFLS